MKRTLLLFTLLALMSLAVVLPAPAGAAVPCRNKVFNDWYADGKIASTYPIACYRDALKHIPIDARVYSSLSDDIRSAMRAAVRRSHGFAVPRQVGHGFSALGAGNVKGAVATIPAEPHDPNTGSATSPTASTATTAASSPTADSSSSVPLPIIILGAIAIALAAAGAIGVGVRHWRGRGTA
ncbi:MAG: hypothetical protein ACJ77E_19270 [Gaiellaceae bacterium]